MLASSNTMASSVFADQDDAGRQRKSCEGSISTSLAREHDRDAAQVDRGDARRRRVRRLEHEELGAGYLAEFLF
jgi:hypothetical protein